MPGEKLMYHTSSVLRDWDTEKGRVAKWAWEFKDRNDLCPDQGGDKDVENFLHVLIVLGDKRHLCNVFSLKGQVVILTNFPQVELNGNRWTSPTLPRMEQSIQKSLLLGSSETASATHMMDKGRPSMACLSSDPFLTFPLLWSVSSGGWSPQVMQ